MTLTKNDKVYLLSAMYAEAEKTFLQIKTQFPLWAASEDTRRAEYLATLIQTWSSRMWLIKELSAELGHRLPDLQRQEFNRLVVLDWTVNDIKKAFHSPLVDREFILHELNQTEKLRKKYFLFNLFPQDLAKRPDVYLNFLQYFLSGTKDIEGMSNDKLLSAIKLGQSFFNIYQTASKSLHQQVKLTEPLLIAFNQRLIELKTQYHKLHETVDVPKPAAHHDAAVSNKISRTYETLSGRCTFHLDNTEPDIVRFGVEGEPGLKGNKLAFAEKQIYQDMLRELKTPKPKPTPVPFEASLFEHVTLKERSRVEDYEPDGEMITVSHPQSIAKTQGDVVNLPQKQSLMQNLGKQLTRFFTSVKRLVFPDPDAAFLARSKASRSIKQSQITQTVEESAAETEQQTKIQNKPAASIKRSQSVTEIKDEDDDIRPNGPKVR